MANVGIISASFALQSLRNSGYKSSALAVAELIDNSIDAGASNIDIINLSEQTISPGNRKSLQQVKAIGILDNGSGMDLNTLHKCLSLGWGTKLEDESGLGKYGFGLKGASLATCRKVSVYTWQNPNDFFKVHIDLDDIIENSLDNIEDPVREELPERIKQEFGDKIGNSGTLILWEKLDKIDFSLGKTLVDRFQRDFCRIYRHFLDDDDKYGVKRNIKIHIIEDSGKMKKSYKLKANDPLYLLTPNNLSSLYENESTNELFDKIDTEVTYLDSKGEEKTSPIEIIATISKPQIQAIGGGTELGKHYGRNLGISFVREGREIDLSNFGFFNGSQETQRWWGIEVRFKPELDDIFGVTTNKQNVTNVRFISQDEAQELNDQIGYNVYKTRCLLELSKHIKDLNSKMMKLITIRGKGTRQVPGKGIDDIETKVNRNINKNTPTESNEIDIKISSDQKKAQEIKMTALLRKNHPNLSDQEILTMHKELEDKQVTLKFDNWPGNLFLDRQCYNACAIGVINQNTEFYKRFYDLLDDMDDPKAIDALKILLMAYVRAEDEMAITQALDSKILENFRSKWSDHIEKLIPISHDAL